MKTSTPLEICMTLSKKDNLKLKIDTPRPSKKMSKISNTPVPIYMQYTFERIEQISKWCRAYRGYIRQQHYRIYIGTYDTQMAYCADQLRAVLVQRLYAMHMFTCKSSSQGFLAFFQLEGQNQDLQICHHPQFQRMSNTIK